MYLCNKNLWPTTAAAAAAKLLQSCPTLCDLIDGSPPHSPVPGIFQARTLEWVAISFSSAWKWKVKMKLLSHVQLLATPWTAAYQAPPPMGFSRQEYWSGVPELRVSDLKGSGEIAEKWTSGLEDVEEIWRRDRKWGHRQEPVAESWARCRESRGQIVIRDWWRQSLWG